ncbi:unnamed protein product [Symbiodinium natans]|uniref:Uncharacterized protein n=1 Tax=Symbiodinium natans TaxID=878477 RepID=A0A812PMG3_9DINO|nr:unnamed protein product [Symbiodinium natans]
MSRTFHISVKIWAMLPKCCALLLMLLPTSAAAAVECIEDGLKLAEDVNQYRMDAGLAPLKVSPSLIEVATIKANHPGYQLGGSNCDLHSWGPDTEDPPRWTACCF